MLTPTSGGAIDTAEDPEQPLDADAAAVAGRDAPSTCVILTKDKIIEAPLEHLDEVGLPGLTVRKLGERMGVRAMSLDYYVPGKEDLLDAMVESPIAGMYEDDEVLEQPENGWQNFLMCLAHGVRRLALPHVNAFPLVASRPPEAPWLRPPLSSLDWVETFLSGLIDESFSRDAAVAAYRSFTSFLLGCLLLEVASQGADIGPLDVIDDGEEDNQRLADFPTVRGLRAEPSEDHAAAEFEEVLEDLLNRIALTKVELSADTKGSP